MKNQKADTKKLTKLKQIWDANEGDSTTQDIILNVLKILNYKKEFKNFLKEEKENAKLSL